MKPLEKTLTSLLDKVERYKKRELKYIVDIKILKRKIDVLKKALRKYVPEDIVNYYSDVNEDGQIQRSEDDQYITDSKELALDKSDTVKLKIGDFGIDGLDKVFGIKTDDIIN